MPMRGNDQLDCLRRVNANVRQIVQGTWLSIFIDAGIDDDPGVGAKVQDDAFPIPRPEQRQFQLFGTRRCIRLRHGLSA